MTVTADTPASARITLYDLVSPGIAAVRRFWRPFVTIQLVALALVIAYYQSESMRNVCQFLADLKLKWGYFFSFIASSISAAIIPELFKAITMGEWKVDRARLKSIGFNLIFFGSLGVYIDAFYRFNAVLFGNEPTLWTVTKKMLVDQLISSVLITIPISAIVFTWKNSGASLIDVVRGINLRWFLLRCVVLLIPCWCFWTPTVMLVYAMPNALQFSLYSLANAAWSILMVAVASRK